MMIRREQLKLCLNSLIVIRYVLGRIRAQANIGHGLGPHGFKGPALSKF